VLTLCGSTVFLGAATASAAGAASESKPALCTASAVHVRATTDHTSYGPGRSVRLRSSITNVSGTPCSVWLGLDPGFSPSFVVVNSRKAEVWDRCWIDDHPGACFEILYQHRLGPGGSYRTVAVWDQGSTTGSRPPRRVHPGVYSFLTYYQYIVGAQVTFTIAPAGGAGPETVRRTAR